MDRLTITVPIFRLYKRNTSASEWCRYLRALGLDVGHCYYDGGGWDAVLAHVECSCVVWWL